MPRRIGKSKVYIPTMATYMRKRAQLSQDDVLNPKAHEILHGPATLVYTSKVALDTVAGSKLKLPRGGQVTAVACKLQGAPSGSKFQVDLLIDDISVFDAGTYLEVAVGETASRFKILTRPYFNDESVFKVKINAVNAATGPMVLTIEYMADY